ncbi:MAG: radical SAM family heme chaperone HemW [Caldicoprobacter sp.]|uniref:radical SAM family heme chaperone HemW n=1 Tax=Caldicoprobacter sp. TaxID=2004500 RepID=UPI0039C45211
MRQLGVYIHFPFCARKCHYCDFPSYQGMERWMQPYLEALCREILEWKEKVRDYAVKSIYLGGGTPTLFSGEQIARLLEICFNSFNVQKNAEITVEANPGTVDMADLFALRSAGVNRLSIGLQAWQDRHLRFLGRIHSSSDFVQSIMYAKEAGFENINVDVMFGLPSQTIEEWLETLEKVCSLKIQHISMYSLKVEDGTPLHRWYEEGKFSLPSQEEDRLMYYKGREYVKRFGLRQYEISNFAIPGKECVHNLIYWHNEEYIGCGSGAHSYFNDERFSNTSDVEEYIRAVTDGTPKINYRERIGEENERFETIMMGLRLVEGVNKQKFKARFGKDIEFYYGKAIRKLVEQGLLIDDEVSIKLTEKGMDVQNVALLEFMQ